MRSSSWGSRVSLQGKAFSWRAAQPLLLALSLCNTVLMAYRFGDYHIALIPPGIGVSYILPESAVPPRYPLRSGYLLLDAATYESLKDRTHLTRLDSIPDGTVYRNDDAQCS